MNNYFGFVMKHIGNHFYPRNKVCVISLLLIYVVLLNEEISELSGSCLIIILLEEHVFTVFGWTLYKLNCYFPFSHAWLENATSCVGFFFFVYLNSCGNLISIVQGNLKWIVIYISLEKKMDCHIQFNYINLIGLIHFCFLFEETL